MPELDKLTKFTAAITEDAVAESNRIYEEIKAESEAAMTKAEDDALNETFRYIKKEVDHIRTETGRRISKRVMENKRSLYIRREEIKVQVLDEVVKRIEDYVRTPEYLNDLTAKLKAVVKEFGGDTIAYLCPRDMAYIPKLEKIRFSDAIEFQEGHFELGGLQASCPGKRLQMDESFDTALNEIRGNFAEMSGLEFAD